MSIKYFEVIKNDSQLAEKIDYLCDFSLYKTLKKFDTRHCYSEEPYRVFATDASGGTFGFIGPGSPARLSIGYCSSEGSAGRIATNVDDFFRLLVFYPFWRDLCKFSCIHDPKMVEFYENSFIEDMAELNFDYSKEQEYIADVLQLTKRGDILNKFHSVLKQEPKFIMHCSEDDTLCNNLI
ncbi:MAG: hypothetical protein FWD70_04395 [Desulfuromonadales bacterium]|nr:hypothetical protein [Desulfuromonadales bacterium]